MVVPPLFQRVPQRGKGPGLRSLLARYRPRLSIISRKTFWKTQARRYHSTGGRPRTGSDFTIDDRKTVGAPILASLVDKLPCSCYSVNVDNKWEWCRFVNTGITAMI